MSLYTSNSVQNGHRRDSDNARKDFLMTLKAPDIKDKIALLYKVSMSSFLHHINPDRSQYDEKILEIEKN